MKKAKEYFLYAKKYKQTLYNDKLKLESLIKIKNIKKFFRNENMKPNNEYLWKKNE